jgi:hypothetical protein
VAVPNRAVATGQHKNSWGKPESGAHAKSWTTDYSDDLHPLRVELPVAPRGIVPGTQKCFRRKYADALASGDFPVRGVRYRHAGAHVEFVGSVAGVAQVMRKGWLTDLRAGSIRTWTGPR